ncbi:hypothetical protein WN943_016067 [Citrus x changshan-huyou]
MSMTFHFLISLNRIYIIFSRKSSLMAVVYFMWQLSSVTIAYYYPFFINKRKNQGDTPLYYATRAGKLKTTTAHVNFAKHIPSTSQAPVNLLRMENTMGNTALHEAFFMLGRVKVWRTSTADSFLAMARSYFSSNPTLAIDDTIKTNIIKSLVAMAHVLVWMDLELSCSKNIEDKSPFIVGN